MLQKLGHQGIHLEYQEYRWLWLKELQLERCDSEHSSLKDGGLDITFTFTEDTTSEISTDLDDENTVLALLDLEWTANDKYTPDYIKQLNQWADIAGITMV